MIIYTVFINLSHIIKVIFAYFRKKYFKINTIR